MGRDWTENAACRNSNINFFPYFRWHGYRHTKRVAPANSYVVRNHREAASEALKICAICPVIEECKRDHLHETDGVFYGTVPSERELPNKKGNCKCMACQIRRNFTARIDHQ